MVNHKLKKGRPVAPRLQFDADRAWHIYQQEGSLVAAAKKLSDILSVECCQEVVISKTTLRDRLAAAGY
jgi:hypothetical protein